MSHEDPDPFVDDGPEQFSQQTRDALRGAVDDLVAALRSHADHVSRLRGRSSEIAGVFEVNEQVERALLAWKDRVFDHTGTFPVALAQPEDALDDEDWADDDEEGPDIGDGAAVAVVTRWDLVITDAEALIAAGREAHKRNQPGEQDEDALVAVPDVGQALYAVLHEWGEPWYDMPGVEVVRGTRSYVRPDEPAEPYSPDDDVDEPPVTEPAGQRLYLESWA